MPTITLGRTTPNDAFRQAVAKWFREGGEVAQRAVSSSPFVRSAVKSLTDAGEYFETLDLDDQLQRTLHSLSVACGWYKESTLEWAPGPDAMQLRANLGLAPRTPTPLEAIAELVGVCVDDALRELQEQRSKVELRAGTAESQVRTLKAAEERAESQAAEIKNLAAALKEAHAETAKRQEEVEHLRSVVAPEKPAAKKRTTKAAA